MNILVVILGIMLVLVPVEGNGKPLFQPLVRGVGQALMLDPTDESKDEERKIVKRYLKTPF